MPINVASGTVSLSYRDISIPGRFPIVWKRSYSSHLSGPTDSPLGPGWSGNFFCTLTRKDNEWYFTDPEGGVVVFRDPEDKVERGGTIRDPGSYHEIAKAGFQLHVTHWDPESHEVLRYVFQPARNGRPWPLRSVETVSGLGLDLAWDESGRLKGVRQKLEKRTLAVSHTSEGRVASIAFLHADGRPQTLLSYRYDGKGRLSEAINALEYRDRYEYDSHGRITRELSKDGGIFSFKYDDKNRCVRTWGLENYDLKIIRYFDAIGRSEVSNSYGHVRRYQFLPSGQVISEMDPMGGEHKFEYDEFGRLSKKTNPVGAATSFEYDESGNRRKITDGLGKASLYTFNERHQAIAHVDACGNAWKKTFDAAGRLESTSDPVGAEWRFTYDNRGLPAEVRNPLGPKLLFGYHENGDLARIRDWDGYVWKYQGDELGRITQIENPAGRKTISAFDLLGNLVSFQTSPSERYTFQYDPKGNRTVSTDAKGKVHKRIYGPCGRLVEKISPRGSLMKYVWGSEPDLLLKIINHRGKTCEFGYDGNGRKIREKDFDGRETFYKRNLAGECIATGDDPHALIRFALDINGRIVSKILPDGSEIGFSYDAMGRMVGAENPDCKLVFKRDAFGRVVKELQGKHVLDFEYDIAGNLAGVALDSGTVISYGYDGDTGLLTDAILNKSHRIRFKRSGPTDPAIRELPGEVSLSHRLGEDGKSLVQRVEKGGTLAYQREFRFNDEGRISAISDSRSGTSRFDYTHFGALAGARYPDGSIERLEYDDAGDLNRIEPRGPAGQTVRIGEDGRIYSKSDRKHEYDASGRLVRIAGADGGETGNWSFAWDALDQLRRVTNPMGETWSYGYDPLGRRVAKDGPDGNSRFVWNRHVIVEHFRKEKLDSAWLYPPSGFIPLGRLSRGEFHSIVTDHLGTPKEMLDSQGDIAWSVPIHLFGIEQRAEEDAPDCEVRFPGQWFDAETGWHYNRFRYYEPDAGRYVSQDPIGLRGGGNPYAYGADPLNWIDPFGLAMLFRGMKKDAEGKPVVHSGPTENGNNAADSLGVRPEETGMSSNTDTANIQEHRKPKSFGGGKSDEKTAMFVIDSEKLAEHGLVHDPDHDTHVSITVAPGEDPATLGEKLAATKELWKPVTPEEAAAIKEAEEKKKGNCSG